MEKYKASMWGSVATPSSSAQSYQTSTQNKPRHTTSGEGCAL